MRKIIRPNELVIQVDRVWIIDLERDGDAPWSCRFGSSIIILS
jgi:hypothetical protein